MENQLTEAAVRQFLGVTRWISEIRCFDVVESTNLYLKELARSGGKSGTVVIANAQSGGRGRMGRQFQSPRGKGIYISFLLRPDLNAEQLKPFTALAGLATCRSIDRICGLHPDLKWPNDLLLEGKKICGMLTELVTVPGEPAAVILGIGINVSQTAADFSPDVAAIASSLEQIGGQPVSRPRLAAALVEEVDAVYGSLLSGKWEECLEEYRARCVHIGRQVRLMPMGGEGEIVTVLDVDEQFGLVVRDAAGQTRVVCSGEISVRPC